MPVTEMAGALAGIATIPQLVALPALPARPAALVMVQVRLTEPVAPAVKAMLGTVEGLLPSRVPPARDQV